MNKKPKPLPIRLQEAAAAVRSDAVNAFYLQVATLLEEAGDWIESAQQPPTLLKEPQNAK